MNQILSTDNNQNKNKSKVDTRKIIVFFCIIIIIFGITFVGMSAYNLYQNRPKDPIVERLNKPEVAIEQMEDGNIKIIAKYDQGIAKISYIWNENDITDSNADGKTYIEKLIEMPEDINNRLEVIAIGTDGKEETLIRKFKKEGDIIDPLIDWVVSNKLLIIATDETELAYLTYKWNNEEEIIIEPTENNKTKIEETIEIIRGTNELTITAVDTSGNIITKTRTFKGVNEPEISWMRYGNTVEVIVSHDMGFEKIVLIVNGIEQVYDKNSSNYNSTQTEVQLQANLQNGDNTIIVKAYSNEGSEKIKEGKTTYNP